MDTEAPEYMKGVINLRGSVLPVVDLRIKFGLPENECSWILIKCSQSMN
jgi:chemotaxis signal transduction protein